MKRYIYTILFILTTTLSFADFNLELEELQFGEYEISNTNKSELLRIVQSGKVATVDPILMKDQYSIRVKNYLYDTLFIYNELGEIIPNLVENWKWRDDTILELNIKSDVYFHNGDKMTAFDVENSLNRMLEEGVFKDLFNDIQSIKVVDDKIIEIKLKGRNNLFLSMLTYYMNSIVKIDDGKLYGTGPYKLDKLTNREVVLIKNENYFKENNGPKKIEIIAEISDRRKAILYFNEDVDVILDITSNQVELWKKEGLLNNNILYGQKQELDTVSLIFGDNNSIFKKRKNRELIKDLLNREKMVEKIFKQKVSNSYFPEVLFKPNLSLISNEKSLTLKEDISKSELKDQVIEIMTLNEDISIRVANELKEQLKEYDIEAEVIPYQQEAYHMKMENKDYQIAVYNILFDENYPVYNLGKIMKHDIGDIDMYNAILPFIEILKDEDKETNREKIYDRIVQLISRSTPYIPLIHRRKIVVGNEKIQLLNQ